MDQRIDIQMNQDLVGFQFFQNATFNLDQYQREQNQTYLVYIAQFYYQDPNSNILQTLYLDVIQCSNPQLAGFYCLDFSKIDNYTLALDNSNNVFSQIFINVYGCRDIDGIKTTIPNNCAPQSDIDQFVNGIDAYFNLKIQCIINILKTQKQQTQVSKGLVFQSQETYQSPIQYTQSSQNFDRQDSLIQGLGPYTQASIELDEIEQQFIIEYPSITEILALVNGVSSIIVVSRILGRFYSLKLLKQEFFMLIFRNMFQEKNEQILHHNKILEQKYDTQFLNTCKKDEEVIKDSQEKVKKKDIVIPNIKTKFKAFVEQNQINIENKSIQLNLQKQNDQENDNQKDDIFFIGSQTESFVLKDQYNRQNSSPNTFNNRNEQFQITQQLNNKDSQQKFRNSNFKSNIQSLKNESKFNSQNTITLSKTENFGALNDHIQQKLKALNNNSMKSYIQSFIFRFKLFKTKEFLLSKGIDQMQLKKISKEVQKSLNIYEMFKDIIFLKKAIMMLLSEDQLAAIQLVSLTDDYLNSNNLEKSMKLNHFERQYSIYQSQVLQKKYIDTFFQKYNDSKESNQIDQRIISSIIKQQ
ncbi:AMP-binding enzyme family protein (macronuclear) [Tetrahymena thermophila SB210]|uniref:AMP-binding enzyme family protein n=1 Tax=Tetrahymena thermophila (strain SB210) TaxID=312017 RepID=W7X805_TETTS|nr:AMP-binding enzyme family protein [Tetrahymena thermophila SB210]EWS72558.1 AMP-binding enzyme family protein [Tetrahymena thermophila SB210]|eukprot:XP_012654841.1 AMP-binding enzyme family protein [Tetrahymena thermophila SB210]